MPLCPGLKLHETASMSRHAEAATHSPLTRLHSHFHCLHTKTLWRCSGTRHANTVQQRCCAASAPPRKPSPQTGRTSTRRVGRPCPTRSAAAAGLGGTALAGLDRLRPGVAGAVAHLDTVRLRVRQAGKWQGIPKLTQACSERIQCRLELYKAARPPVLGPSYYHARPPAAPLATISQRAPCHVHSGHYCFLRHHDRPTHASCRYALRHSLLSAPFCLSHPALLPAAASPRWTRRTRRPGSSCKSPSRC